MFGVISLSSCSSPESVAEKALKEIGSGKYKKSLGIISTEKLTLFNQPNSVFERYEIKNCEAVDFGRVKYHANRVKYHANLVDIYFQTETLFERYQLIDKKQTQVGLYFYFEMPDPESMSEEEQKANLIVYKYYLDLFKDNPTLEYTDNRIKAIEYNNVSKYILTYKLDNKYITEISVIKHPKDGLKVTSFIFH